MWLTPEVKEHLIYWKNPRDSGIVFGLVLVFLIGIKHVSIISVLANMALALITSTMAFRIYKSVLSAVNKTQDGHPFKVSILNQLGRMYALTYIGKMFNGLTLIIIAWVTIFSAPKIYRDNQEKIDEALLPIKEKVDDLLVKLKATAAAKKQD
eukprot:11531.XXX_742376_741234_1 [CDS] Oithona nana genome sequencing.